MRLRSLPLVILATLPLLAGCTNWRFTSTIEREYSTSEEAALIDVAEHVSPTSEDPLDPLSLEKETEFDGKSTYASMTNLIDTCSQRIDTLQRECPLLMQLLLPSVHASLKYWASIQFQEHFTNDSDSFDNVYVVYMNIVYDQSFGPMTVSGFRKERTAVLTSDGEVRAFYSAAMSWIS